VVSDTGWPMADGHRVDPRDDGAEQAALADEGRLLRRVRWRLVAWSGVSTLIVLLVLAVALYAAVANTLAGAGTALLTARVDPLVQFLEGGRPERPAEGFIFGGGSSGTFAMILDENGTPLVARRDQAIPDGLPDPAGVTAAGAAPGAPDIREAVVVETPVRILTQRVVAADGTMVFVQVVQDRTTEVSTLDALLAVLAIGGLLVVLVAFGLGTVYARRALVPIRESLSVQRTALRRQREFAADASHELRTPLTVIRSSVEHLSRHRDRPIGDATEALDDIDAEVTHLTALVDDLLLLARSDSGAVPMERVSLDLGDVAFEAASALSRTADARGVHVAVDPEPSMVDGDPARLRQLVMILVDNAIRHSPRGGAVTVTVRATAGKASVEVTDDGPGLRPEDMPHVFDRFWRAPAAPSGGTGLGLAIARWIAERHAGRIGVTNRDGGGAAFRVELPAHPSPVPAPAMTAG